MEMDKKNMINYERLDFITIVYGIAVILVVFGHSHPLHIETPFILNKITEFIYKFHMPLFFFISGILIVYTSKKRISIWRWWRKKVSKLIIPYLILSGIAIIPKFLLGRIMNDDMTFSFDNIIKIIFIPRQGIWGHFWFIPTYLVLSLIGAIIFYILNEVQKSNSLVVKIGYIFICILGFILYIHPIRTEWFAIEDISIEFIYVILGIVSSRWIINISMKKISYFLILFCGVLSILIFMNSNSRISDFYISILMIISVLGIGMSISHEEQNIFTILGKHAFTIYLYSWPFQVVAEICIVVILGLGWYISYPFMFLCGIFGPIIILKIYKKIIPRNKLCDVLLGVE